jgi:hypothetical protein
LQFPSENVAANGRPEGVSTRWLGVIPCTAGSDSIRPGSGNRIMNHLKIEVWDATGNKKQIVEVPADAAVNRVIAVLVEKMSLPRQSPDGQLMSYKFHHKASGRQLLDSQSLHDAEVRDGDVLRLQPEITAG